MKGVRTIKKLTLRLEDDLHKELKHKTVDMGVSMNEHIVKLIKKDMEKSK